MIRQNNSLTAMSVTGRKTFAGIIFLFLLSLPVTAQPPARLRQQKQQAAQKQEQKAVGVSQRAQLEYPVAPSMPEDVSWRRDLYRVINLTDDKNAVLYYPKEPEDGKMNLFTFLFKLVMRQQVKAYKYTMTGKESFNASNVENREDILKRHNIAYQKSGDKFRILDIDIPSADVKSYFIKESTYFDQHTSQFRTQVTAICPVREAGDEFGGTPLKYPMFWLKYDDIAPYLAKLDLMASNYNNAAVISADDYFNTNKYEGKIYMTSNLQDKTIDQSDTAALKKEQTRIETELATLESHVWGTDSAALKRMQAAKDSTQAAQGKNATTRRSRKQKSDDTSTSSRSQLKRQKSSGSSSASKPRITVRRQRH